MHRIVELIKTDGERLKILEAVASLGFPDCYIAAGFVRNMVWDHIHDYSGTELNDIDVVYYSQSNLDDSNATSVLSAAFPKYEWQIKNQASMHLRNGDEPYLNTVHAMAHWPELETAVGVRMAAHDQIEVVAPFGLDSLFSGIITRNPNRESHVFLNRVKSKGWVEHWPKLKVRL